jgi:hypothetical protein
MNSLSEFTGSLGIDQQRQGLHGRPGHWHKVLERPVGQLAVQRRVDDHHAGVGQHQGVAIRGGLHHLLGADGAPGASLVVHQNWLPQHRLQPVRQEARMLIQRTTGRESDHDANGFAREGLRGHRASQTPK